MASSQHLRWLALGGHWQLAQPLAALRDRLRGYGYTVYDIGDAGHLDHQPPEDHTPYSETGWPGTTPYGWVTAIDVMPPPTGRGLPSLQVLGARIYADKQAGVPGVAWLKYMNWEPDRDNGGSCWHDRWTPGHVRTASGDRGHIHLSCRSDVTQSHAGDTYNPIARLRGEDSDMSREDVINIVNLLAHGTSMAGYAGQDSEPLNDIAATVNLEVLKNQLDELKVAVAKLAAPAVDVQALAAALAPQLAVDQAAVVAALESPAGQAALNDALSLDRVKLGTLEAFREIGANISTGNS